MTSKLEKKFFDTFGIKKKELEYPDNFTYYPEITDRILLELICIANKYEYYSISTNIKNIQAQTLRILLKVKKYLKDTYLHQGCHNGLVRKVRTLFEDYNNDR